MQPYATFSYPFPRRHARWASEAAGVHGWYYFLLSPLAESVAVHRTNKGATRLSYVESDTLARRNALGPWVDATNGGPLVEVLPLGTCRRHRIKDQTKAVPSKRCFAGA